MATKSWPRCNRWKELSEFEHNSGNPHEQASRCKMWHKQDTREYLARRRAAALRAEGRGKGDEASCCW